MTSAILRACYMVVPYNSRNVTPVPFLIRNVNDDSTLVAILRSFDYLPFFTLSINRLHDP